MGIVETLDGLHDIIAKQNDVIRQQEEELIQLRCLAHDMLTSAKTED